MTSNTINPILRNSSSISPSKKRARPEDGDNTDQSPTKIPRTEPATNVAPVFNNDRRAFKRFKVRLSVTTNHVNN